MSVFVRLLQRCKQIMPCHQAQEAGKHCNCKTGHWNTRLAYSEQAKPISWKPPLSYQNVRCVSDLFIAPTDHKEPPALSIRSKTASSWTRDNKCIAVVIERLQLTARPKHAGVKGHHLIVRYDYMRGRCFFQTCLKHSNFIKKIHGNSNSNVWYRQGGNIVNMPIDRFLLLCAANFQVKQTTREHY